MRNEFEVYAVKLLSMHENAEIHELLKLESIIKSDLKKFSDEAIVAMIELAKKFTTALYNNSEDCTSIKVVTWLSILKRLEKEREVRIMEYPKFKVGDEAITLSGDESEIVTVRAINMMENGDIVTTVESNSTGQLSYVGQWELIRQVQSASDIHSRICTEMTELYKAKNNDYGNSFAMLRGRFSNSILIRLYDKLFRLETLLSDKPQMVKDESIDDTLRDIANYCIMELVEREIDRNK